MIKNPVQAEKRSGEIDKKNTGVDDQKTTETDQKHWRNWSQKIGETD